MEKVNRDLLDSINETEVNFDEYIGIIFRRKNMILILFVLIFLPFFYLGLIQPEYYETKSIAVIEESQTDQLIPSTNQHFFRYRQRSTSSPAYYNLIVQSNGFKDKIAAAVMDTLNRIYGKNYSIEQVKELLDASIDFSPYREAMVNQGSMIANACQFRVVSENPEIAYLVVKKGFNVLKKMAKNIENQKTNQMLSFIQEQKKILEEKIIENEKEIQKFKDETGISLTDDLGGIEREIKKIQLQKLETKTQWQLEEAKVKAIEEQIREYDQILKKKYNIKINFDTLALKKRYTDLIEKRNRYLDNPVVFKKEIDEIEKQLADITSKTARQIIRSNKKSNSSSARLNVTYYTELLRKKDEALLNIKMLKSTEKYYQNLYDKYRTSNPQLLEQKTQMAKLILTKEVLNKRYNFFIEKEQQEKINNFSSATELKLVNPGSKPAAPLPRTTKKFWLIGIIVSLILSFSSAFFIEMFDSSIKTPEDIKKYFLLPTLGIIPKINPHSIPKQEKDEVDMNLITYIKPNHQISESYRTLRTNLEHIDPQNKIKTLMVTSPSPMEGKSLSISNLSILFALKELNVVLVDLDLRKPKIHTIFHMDRKPGLYEAMTHPDEPVKKYVKSSPIPNLSVLTVGDMVEKPAEILGSAKFNRLFERLKEEFDMVLLDTPPVNVVTDAALISTKVDGVLLVVSALQTNKNSAKYCLELLNRVKANVLGILLNKILISKRYGSYGYYYYKRYYKSYYSYYHKEPDDNKVNHR